MSKIIPELGFDEFAALYCDTQASTPDTLKRQLQRMILEFGSEGFILLECIVLDSSSLGQRVVVGYGGDHTLKTVPDKPFSPRGLTSDISRVIAVMKTDTGGVK